MQIKSLGLDAPAALDASSGPALSELPPRATIEHATTNTYTCYSARNWARHDDDKQQEVFVLFLAVLMLLAAPAAPHERGAPTTTRAVTETVSSFGEAQRKDMNVQIVGKYCSAPVCDEGGCCNKHMQDHTSGTATEQVKLTGKVALCPDSATSFGQGLLLESSFDDKPLVASKEWTTSCATTLSAWSLMPSMKFPSVSLKPPLAVELGTRGATAPVPVQLKCTWECKRAHV